MPFKMRFSGIWQMRDGELWQFYAVSADFWHSQADGIKAPIVKVRFALPFHLWRPQSA